MRRRAKRLMLARRKMSSPLPPGQKQTSQCSVYSMTEEISSSKTVNCIRRQLKCWPTDKSTTATMNRRRLDLYGGGQAGEGMDMCTLIIFFIISALYECLLIYLRLSEGVLSETDAENQQCG